ncbi:MAG: twin-arginine translocase TatA/TatE family subunit [Rhodanobacter sp.]
MSIWHLVLLLVVVVVIFGTGKLRHIGSDLGSALRDFKKGLGGDDDEEAKRKADAERLRADSPVPPVDQTTQSQRDSSDSK